MFSWALLAKLSCLDFLLLKGESQGKVCLCKILWLSLYEAVVCSNILQIRETGFYIESPTVGKIILTADFKILITVGEP
jgi:hypothetical protein